MQKIILFLLVSLSVIGPLNALAVEPEDKTLSPYFFVQSDNPDLDRLPLKSTQVAVTISGVMADVTVTQTYQNEGTSPIEAIYVFPAATKAAVYAMKMTIGERTLEAKIAERAAARQAYETAKEQGKSASLLEQHRPNVFQMNVANILPKDKITVELKYTELLVPVEGEYQFVYPTVVGPRYADPAQETHEQWAQNPYLHEGEPPTNTFDIHVLLNAGLPVQEMSCPSHDVAVTYNGKTSAQIKLNPSETFGGNRDYILTYRLCGKKIQTGLLLYEGENENHFLLMVQPPKQVRAEEIPSREYVFIVDVSGSMHGFPLDLSKKLLRDLIGNLRPTDRFNVLLFAGSASVLSSCSLPATEENLHQAIQTIEKQQGGGGTRLLPALEKAFDLPGTEGFSRNIVIATDGYVAVEQEAFDLIRNRLGEANVFSFGIGSSVNRHLIEGMARIGMSEPFILTDPKQAPAAAEKFRKLIETPALTNLRIHWNGFEVYDVEPPSIPDVMADRPVIVFGKWQGHPKGRLELTGQTKTHTISQKIDVGKATPLAGNAALRYLWARHRIAVLSDYNLLHQDDDRVKEVTRLGLSYNLLTAYTSFVAVDSVTRIENGKAVTIKQPLPLPQGVSDYAVGGRHALMSAQPLMAPPNYAGMRVKGQVAQEAIALKEESKKEEDEKSLKIRLVSIEKHAGFSKEELRRIITKQLANKMPCTTIENHTGPFSLSITVDAKGLVTAVTCPDQPKISDALLACLEKMFKKTRLPSPATKTESTIVATFEVL